MVPLLTVKMEERRIILRGSSHTLPPQTMVSINNRGILMQRAVTGDHPESCKPMAKSVSTIMCQGKRDMYEGQVSGASRGTIKKKKKLISELRKSVIAYSLK